MRAYLALALLAVSVAGAPKSLPSNWKICKKSDPKLNECFRDSVNAVIGDLSAKGAKSFGVFPIEPLIMSALDIDQGNGPVSIELHFRDLHISGLKNAKITNTKVDVDQYRFEADVETIPELTLIANYTINGKVLVLPITGSGPCELKLEKVKAHVLLQGKEMKTDGQNYMNVTDFKFTFTPDLLKMKFDNLFNGNKQLSQQMNTFLNENWREILKELQPAIQDAFGAAFAEITSRIFSKVPYNKIFPA